MKRVANARGTAVSIDHVSAEDLKDFAKTNTPCRRAIYKKDLDRAGMAAAFRGVFEASGNGWCIDKFESRFPAPKPASTKTAIPVVATFAAVIPAIAETSVSRQAGHASQAIAPAHNTSVPLLGRAERALLDSGLGRQDGHVEPVGATRAQRAMAINGRVPRPTQALTIPANATRAERAIFLNGRTPHAPAETLPPDASRAERALFLCGRTTRQIKPGDRQ